MHHEQAVYSHSGSQFLLEKSLGNNASETEDCETNGYPYVESWTGKKDWELYPKFIV